ncbi:hypothetical protein Kfla_0014 [Kribbella flavida DSM 17836]|uniref:Uncharacterized protein n=1 Tax=Kribbella flavida (strain DSM 17836 / JCM 10339 / NBRC 14399) TaxID=479435 RepID=D2PQF8_KRIFD|nr:hypothetical protein Kfla_0014 [Kribbella flavida DSM 17836]
MAADFHASNPASNLESRALRVPHPLPQAGPVVGRELVAGVSQVVGMGQVWRSS